MVHYSNTRLCVGGTSSALAVISAAITGYLYYLTFYTNIEMGVLIIGPLMISSGLLGLFFAMLAVAYLSTELSKCDKRKGDLVIGGVTGAAALVSIGCAAYLMLQIAQEGSMFAIPFPVLSSLLLIGVVCTALSAIHLTKTLNNEKQQDLSTTINTEGKPAKVSEEASENLQL